MIFAKNFGRNYENKIGLGTSDAWSLVHLYKRTSVQAYYIVDWRILDLLLSLFKNCYQMRKLAVFATFGFFRVFFVIYTFFS